MASSDSGDEYELDQPDRKKRKPAKEKFPEGETLLTTPEVKEIPGTMESGSAELTTDRSRPMAPDLGIADVSDRQLRTDDDDGDNGCVYGDEEIEGLDSDEDDPFESVAEGEPASSSKIHTQDQKASNCDFSDFAAPPPKLHKILAKRQLEIDNIRRQLPIDNRSREQKLSDWYKMLSKLDKPVALLSLISTPQQE